MHAFVHTCARACVQYMHVCLCMNMDVSVRIIIRVRVGGRETGWAGELAGVLVRVCWCAGGWV